MATAAVLEHMAALPPATSRLRRMRDSTTSGHIGVVW